MVSRKEFDEGNKYKRFVARLSDPKPAIKQIGFMMVSESQRSFKEQKFGRDYWVPRAVPNRFGVLADFSLGGRTVPPKRRFEDRPALLDTGNLRRSIAWKAIGRNSLEVGTAVRYASVLQYGGESESVTITESIQKKLKNWLAGKGEKWLGYFSQYLEKKWLGKKDTIEIQARPFIGITKQTREDIMEAVGTKIFEIS